MKENTKSTKGKKRINWEEVFEQFMTMLFVIVLAAIVIFLLIVVEVDNEKQNKTAENTNHVERIMTESIYKVKQQKEYQPGIDELCYAAQKEIEGKLYELSYVEDVMQWYVEYKELVDKHTWLLGEPQRIYDEYEDDEIYLIQRAVETETYQCYFTGKANVASVILNRISDGRFGDTIKKIITNPGQFAWHRTNISESTVLAVEFAYELGDTTDGCIAFRSDRKPEKWGKWKYSFSDNSVHHFYK